MSQVRDSIRGLTPERIRGSEDLPLGYTLKWDLEFENPVAVSGRPTGLRVGAVLVGPIKAEARFLPDFNFHGVVTASIRAFPSLREDLGIRLASSTSFDLDLIWKTPLGDIDVGELFEDKPASRLNEVVGGVGPGLAGMFRDQAERALKLACGNFAVAPEQGVELQFDPVAARATQPRIDSNNISLTLGMDAYTSMGSSLAEPECVSLDRVSIEEEITSNIDVVMPVTIGYEQLDSALTSEFVGKELGTGVVATIESVSVRPAEGSVLLTTDVSIRETEWFGVRAEGTVYILAEPRLDTEEQVLRFSRVEVDSYSRNRLAGLFGAFGESWLEALVNESILDLAPLIDEWTAKAEATLNSIDLDDVALGASIENASLVRLDIGPESLRLVVLATGNAAVVGAG